MMKSTTRITIGMKHIGKATEASAPHIFEGTLIDSLQELIKWIGARSMATRFEIVIARTRVEVEACLIQGLAGRNATGRKAYGLEDSIKLLGALDDLANEMGFETDGDDQ